MDFFARQERAQRNTKLLVLYFIAGVLMLIATVYLVSVLIFSGASMRHQQFEGSIQIAWWNPRIFLWAVGGTLAVIVGGGIVRTLELSQGGSAVAEMLGGRLVNPNTKDFHERKLLNIIEEMALASGVPVPQVYVIDGENGINAFAAGFNTSDAAVCVTSGCMRILSRDELQGVIAHEFSHILNGDMRLNLRLMGIIFGILCLAVIGRILLHTRSRGSRDKNPLPFLGLGLLIIGWIGVFFARLIQAAISRQREFLADASAVQFTRNPQGIGGALKKIGGLGETGSLLQASRAQEASHMFFSNGLPQPLFGLMATHPPLTERIRAIEPQFDGKFPYTRYVPEEEAPYKRSQPAPPPPSHDILNRVLPPIIAAETVMPNLGTPNPLHLSYAVEMRDAFPEALKDAAHDPMGAMALICGLVISTDPATRGKELELLAQNTSPAVRAETERLLPAIAPMAMNAKLPLVDLALPALRQLSPAQYTQFTAAIQKLIEADGEISLFEYMLQKIVLRHLDPHFHGARKQVTQYYALKPLAAECSILLSAIARVGAEDPARAEAAFQRGAYTLSHYAQAPLRFVPENQCTLGEVDAALNRFSQAVPQIKKNVLNACVQTVAADNVIQEMEAELLRAIADTLDCPMPPFVQPQPAAVSAKRPG